MIQVDGSKAIGYQVIGLIRREQKKRRRKSGRARGFYEGYCYVYVRVRMYVNRKWRTRDLYLGRPGAPAERFFSSGRKAARAPTSPAPARSGQARGTNGVVQPSRPLSRTELLARWRQDSRPHEENPGLAELARRYKSVRRRIV